MVSTIHAMAALPSESSSWQFRNACGASPRGIFWSNQGARHGRPVSGSPPRRRNPQARHSRMSTESCRSVRFLCRSCQAARICRHICSQRRASAKRENQKSLSSGLPFDYLGYQFPVEKGRFFARSKDDDGVAAGADHAGGECPAEVRQPAGQKASLARLNAAFPRVPVSHRLPAPSAPAIILGDSAAEANEKVRAILAFGRPNAFLSRSRNEPGERGPARWFSIFSFPQRGCLPPRPCNFSRIRDVSFNVVQVGGA